MALEEGACMALHGQILHGSGKTGRGAGRQTGNHELGVGLRRFSVPDSIASIR